MSKESVKQTKGMSLWAKFALITLCTFLVSAFMSGGWCGPASAQAAATYQATGTVASGTGALTVAWPSHQVDDVALLFVETANEAVATPSGFTAVANSPQSTGTAATAGATRLSVFWARATSSSMPNVSVADSGNHTVAVIVTFRGVASTGDPVEASAGSVKASATTTTTFPAVSTTTAGAVIVLAAAVDLDSASTAVWSAFTNGNLTGLAERVDQTVTSGVGGGLGIATGTFAGTGSTGTSSGTLTSSITTQMTIALKPDLTSPTVTIDEAGGQSDPTSTSPINFTVVFSENTTTFATGDVTITGTAGGTKTATVTGSGTTYNVAVSGMTTSGTVIATIGAGVATDIAGNANTASTSTDNSVTWTYVDTTQPTVDTFTVPATSGSLTISGITLTASDNIGVTGYLINESATPPAAGAITSPTAPTTYTAASAGVKTLYAWVRDAAGNVSNAFAGQNCTITVVAVSPLMHTSANLGTKYGSWGETWSCQTCHNSTTSNIKNIDTSIVTPTGARPVVFTLITASQTTVTGTMGNDQRPDLTKSDHVCEVCHHQTSYHQYSSIKVGVTLTHENRTDCVSCHNHSSGFKVAVHAVPLYATTDGHTGCASGIGCHANTNPLATYPTAGSAPDCRACHTKADPTVATNGCGSCHGVANGNGEPTGTVHPDAAGSHTVHTALTACTNCHDAGGSGDSVNHGKGNRGTNPGIVNLAAGMAWNSGNANCANATCHTNPYGSGSSTTPAWGTSAGCSACHGAFPIGATGPATGSHANTPGHAVACITCHEAGTTATTKPSAGHDDTNIDVVNVGYATPNKAKGTAGTTCSTATCHANPYVVGGYVTTPDWGSTGNGCAACHTGANIITANGPATGNHTNTPGHAVACITCHEAGTTATTAPSSGHIDTNIDVANVGYATLNKTKGTAGTTCSNATCHANPYVVDGYVTTPAWGSTGNGCDACHTGANVITANGPATGSHTNTPGHAVACITCHEAGTTATTAPSTGHIDTNIDVANVGYATLNKTKGTPGTTCSNASCHGNVYGSGSGTTPAWGSTGAGCNTCHSAFPIGANGPATGSHAGHAGRACTDCHAAGTTATSAPSTGHNDTNIDVVNVGYNPDVTKHAADTGYSSCSNFYCHSYGTKAAAPFTANAAPVWGGSVECFSCHGSDRVSLNNISTGRHKKHVAGTYSYDYGCAVCHAATVSSNSTISDPAKHVNVQIDVGFSGLATTGGASATYTTSGHAPGQPGTVNDSCQNIYCHSNAQIQPGHANPQFRNLTGSKRWGQTGTLGGCTGCHGSSTTTGQWALSGKHLAHTASPVAFNCNQCHLSGGTNSNRINHSNGLVNYSSQWTGRATLADGKCNNVYCHSNGKGTFVNMSNANWFSTRTLDCKGCHGGASSQAGEPNYASGAAGSATANSHPTHVTKTGIAASCQNCHSNTVTGVLLNATTHNVTLGTSSRAIPYHADQSIGDTNAGVYSGNGKTFTYTAGTKTCSNISCHSGNGLVAGVADAQWGASFTCESCHGSNAGATNKITSGQHGKHTNQAGVLGVNFGCVECHAQTVTNDTTLAAGTAHMNALANFSGAKAGKNKASCSTAYCHSDGKGGAGETTVSWSTGPALDCKGCHGGASSQAGEPFYLSTAPGTLKTNSHPKHVGTTGADATCQNCHGNTMSGTGLNASGNHLNGGINVIQGNGKTFTYSNDSTKTCSNISCHSGGGMFTAADVQWGATMPADCTGCHGNEASATLSGAHNAHLNSASTGGSFKCKDCHAPTITNADNRTIANANNHGNALVNFSGARAGKNKNCSNIYCHSNGKGAFAAIPTWTSGTNLDCNGCHAQGALSANYAHAPHLAKGAACSQCHSATTTTDSTITGSVHVDGSVNLQQGGTFATKDVSFVPAGGGTCNNISCHSPAATGPYSNTATWGVKATCETCHPKAGLSGNHAVHMGALDLTNSAILYNMTANRTPVQNDTVKTHGFGCANCHPMTVGNHLNGSIEVALTGGQAGMSSLRFLNSTTAANLPSYSGGRCNNIYCHSNASRVVAENAYRQSPTWVGGTFTGDRCAGCHDNQPATGAHAAHAVGNHYENIYNGKSGKVATSNRANTAHGNPNNSTTIGCYICHNATVTSKANDKNTKCAVCHYAGNPVGAQLKGAATIANLKLHVNGAREIEFLPIKVLSKAQIRPESFKFYSGVWQRTSYKNMSTLSYDTAKVALDTSTMWHPSTPMNSNCTNIACHNGKTVNWNLANWNDPNKCMDCHNQL